MAQTSSWQPGPPPSRRGGGGGQALRGRTLCRALLTMHTVTPCAQRVRGHGKPGGSSGRSSWARRVLQAPPGPPGNQGQRSRAVPPPVSALSLARLLYLLT